MLLQIQDIPSKLIDTNPDNAMGVLLFVLGSLLVYFIFWNRSLVNKNNELADKLLDVVISSEKKIGDYKSILDLLLKNNKNQEE